MNSEQENQTPPPGKPEQPDVYDALKAQQESLASGYPQPPIQAPAGELGLPKVEKGNFNQWLIDTAKLFTSGSPDGSSVTIPIPEGVSHPLGTNFIEIRYTPTKKVFKTHPVKSVFWKYHLPSQQPSHWDMPKKAAYFGQILFKSSEQPADQHELTGKEVISTSHGYGIVRFERSMPYVYNNLGKTPDIKSEGDSFVTLEDPEAIKNLALIAKAFKSRGGFPTKEKGRA